MLLNKVGSLVWIAPWLISVVTIMMWVTQVMPLNQDWLIVGGTIKGSLNLPAQSLHQSLPTFYDLCLAAGVKQVIW